jgi:hypothetical protein
MRIPLKRTHENINRARRNSPEFAAVIGRVEKASGYEEIVSDLPPNSVLISSARGNGERFRETGRRSERDSNSQHGLVPIIQFIGTNPRAQIQNGLASLPQKQLIRKYYFPYQLSSRLDAFVIPWSNHVRTRCGGSNRRGTGSN